MSDLFDEIEHIFNRIQDIDESDKEKGLLKAELKVFMRTKASELVV